MRQSMRFILIIRLRRKSLPERAGMPTIYSIKHLTSFRYTPAVGETLMEVRLQPRSDTQQRCIAFSLDVNPRTSVMIYRDFTGMRCTTSTFRGGTKPLL